MHCVYGYSIFTLCTCLGDNMDKTDMDKTEIDNADIDKTVADSLSFLVHLLPETTEYTPKDLLTLSLYANDKYMQPLLKHFIDNKKHYKRKFVSEIIETIEKISSMIHIINSNSDLDNLQKLLKKLQIKKVARD